MLYLCNFHGHNQFEIVNANRTLLQEMSCSRTEWRILIEESRKLMSYSRTEWRILRSLPRKICHCRWCETGSKIKKHIQEVHYGTVGQHGWSFSIRDYNDGDRTNKQTRSNLFVHFGGRAFHYGAGNQEKSVRRPSRTLIEELRKLKSCSRTVWGHYWAGLG